MQLITANGAEVMSSLEIAKLAETTNAEVKRVANILISQGLISHPQIEEGVRMPNGRIESVYHFGERDSYVVMAQVSPRFTARLVDRWRALEADKHAPAPRTPLEMIVVMAQQAVEQERRTLTLESQVSVLEIQLADRARYKTALEIALDLDEPTDNVSLISFGKRLSALARDMKRKIEVDHQDYKGARRNVNSYHPDVQVAIADEIDAEDPDA